MNMSEHPVYVRERAAFVEAAKDPTLRQLDFTDTSLSDFCDQQMWGAISTALNITIEQAPKVFFLVALNSAELEKCIKLWAKQNPEAAKELLA